MSGNAWIQSIKTILKDSVENKWPYPKTFEALKSAGVNTYSVTFQETYRAIYSSDFGDYTETSLENYFPLQSSTRFSKKNIQAAIVHHAENHTPYVEFLSGIAAQGATQYAVDMSKRTVTYFNATKTEFHEEKVPELNQV